MIEFESKFKTKYSKIDECVNNATMSENYIQTYFTDDDGRDKRLRIHYNVMDLTNNKKLNNHAVLCEKKLVGLVDGIEQREEKEEPISLDEAINIVINNLKTTLLKKRYVVPFENYKFEIDIYPEFTNIDADMKDVNGDFVTIEVEFKSKEDRDRFLTLELPSWLGEEVSSDKRYSNRRIAYLEKTNNLVEETVRKFAGLKPKKTIR